MVSWVCPGVPVRDSGVLLPGAAPSAVVKTNPAATWLSTRNIKHLLSLSWSSVTYPIILLTAGSGSQPTKVVSLAKTLFINSLEEQNKVENGDCHGLERSFSGSRPFGRWQLIGRGNCAEPSAFAVHSVHESAAGCAEHRRI